MRDRLRQCYERRRGDLAALAAIAFFFVVFFGWVWTNGLLLVGGDAFSYSYPLRSFVWGELRRGSWPLWLPKLLSGYPLLAMSQVGIAYPLTWGYLFLPPPWAEQLYVLAPFLLAPAFTYAYAREIGRSRLASLLAGLAYGYGGAMTVVLGGVGLMPHSPKWV